MPEPTTITAENIESVRDLLPQDQAEALIPGCRTWAAFSNGSQVQMTVWSDNRAAISRNGRSEWGHWSDKDQMLLLDSGPNLNADGTRR